jgi:hypothetical protein
MALYYGIDAQCNYNNGVTNSGTATLPVINLAAEQAPIQLSFKYYLSTEGSSFFDAATVERSVGGGAYQTIASNQPSGSIVPLDDPSGSWKTVSGIDLSAAAGSTVQLRFRFDTVDDIANSFPGFYVDDVQIVALHDCVFANQNLTLSNQTVTTVQVFEACQTITAGTNFVVAATGDATFHAVQRVKLDPGFKVLAGGKLKVQVP